MLCGLHHDIIAYSLLTAKNQNDLEHDDNDDDNTNDNSEIGKSLLPKHKPNIKSTDFILTNNNTNNNDQKINNKKIKTKNVKKLPLSSHFKDEDDGVDHDNILKHDMDNTDDNGRKEFDYDELDHDFLHNILIETQDQLRAQGAYDQEELEEEVSKLRLD
eukprot:UN10960